MTLLAGKSCHVGLSPILAVVRLDDLAVCKESVTKRIFSEAVQFLQKVQIRFNINNTAVVVLAIGRKKKKVA